MKLVVLGRTGFIGEAIFNYFLGSEGHEVTGYNSSEINLVCQSAADDLAKKLDADTTLIVSARAGKNSDPMLTFEQDIAITNNISRALAITPVKKCIYFSSIAVFGETVDNINITEETRIAPSSFYGISRMVAEFTIKNASDKNEIPLTIFRPCMIYGPGDRAFPYGPDLFLKCVQEGTSVKIFGEGTDRRDYLYIKDLVKITEYFIQNNVPGTFLLGTGQSRSFLDILVSIKEVTNKDVKMEQVKQTQIKIDQKLNIQKLNQVLPDLSFIPFSVGIKETFENIKN